jgi:hypothetical protein
MEEETSRIIAVYIKIRDKKAEIKKQAAEEEAKLDAQLDELKRALLMKMEAAGSESLKTGFGSVRRTLKKKFWTENWDAMYQMINQYDAPYLLEQRIHQTNMRTFLEEHPDLTPPGLNQETEFSVTVTRPRGG